TMISGLSQAAWFDGGKLHAEGLAPSLVGAIVKDPVQDKVVLEEYLETVLKKRPDYAGYYAALNAAI
ncbi:MAG: ATPase, partial [Mesorhizobium sp.]